jgi:hypothetical protein
MTNAPFVTARLLSGMLVGFVWFAVASSAVSEAAELQIQLPKNWAQLGTKQILEGIETPPIEGKFSKADEDVIAKLFLDMHGLETAPGPDRVELNRDCDAVKLLFHAFPTLLKSPAVTDTSQPNTVSLNGIAESLHNYYYSRGIADGSIKPAPPSPFPETVVGVSLHEIATAPRSAGEGETANVLSASDGDGAYTTVRKAPAIPSGVFGKIVISEDLDGFFLDIQLNSEGVELLRALSTTDSETTYCFVRDGVAIGKSRFREALYTGRLRAGPFSESVLKRWLKNPDTKK